jgi:hypothetical protein
MRRYPVVDARIIMVDRQYVLNAHTLACSVASQLRTGTLTGTRMPEGTSSWSCEKNV